MPKVSVLTPIYNTPLSHLKETIDSILSQTFEDFEYLIVNDSPDNLELDKFVKTYNDPRIIYTKNDRNIGLEASTNKLLKMAKGEYVAIFDHDDISLSQRLEKEVEFLDKHPKVGVCSAQFEVFGIQSWVSKNPLSDSAIKRNLKTTSCVSHTTAMFRKSVLEKHNIKYEKRFFPAASYRIITKLALVTQIRNLPDVLVRYRMDGDNTSIRYASMRTKAREKIRQDYLIKLNEQKIINLLKLDSVIDLGSGHHLDGRRYYKAQRGEDLYFIKTTATSHDVEFKFAKKAYLREPSYFIEPIAVHTGEINCFISRWNDGVVDLDVYLKNNKLSAKQKHTFIKDLVKIFTALRQEGIVHRDIIPRNFVVVNGHLKLIDFYYAVEYDNYQEYSFVNDDIRVVGNLGESFAAGLYMWDDACSFKKIAQYINGEESLLQYPDTKKILEVIGDRVIRPDVETFARNIRKLQTVIEDMLLNERSLQRTIEHLQDHNTKQHRVLEEQKIQNEKLNKILSSKGYTNLERIRRVIHILRTR